jgi:hypothetical protein
MSGYREVYWRDGDRKVLLKIERDKTVNIYNLSR